MDDGLWVGQTRVCPYASGGVSLVAGRYPFVCRDRPRVCPFAFPALDESVCLLSVAHSLCCQAVFGNCPHLSKSWIMVYGSDRHGSVPTRRVVSLWLQGGIRLSVGTDPVSVRLLFLLWMNQPCLLSLPCRHDKKKGNHGQMCRIPLYM